MDTSLYSNKEERLVVPISGEQKEQLRRYATERNISMAMAVRLILSDFFKGDLQKKQVRSKENAA